MHDEYPTQLPQDPTDKPDWQREAEQLGQQVSQEILSEIQRNYGGDPGYFLYSKYGEPIFATALRVAVRNLPKNTPPEQLKELAKPYLLNIAIHREAHKRLAEKLGYHPVGPEARVPYEQESITAVTRSGSMVFLGPGAMTRGGSVGYLPIAGREMQLVSGYGVATAGEIIGGEDVKTPGYIAHPSDMLFFDGVKGIRHTSALEEVYSKLGQPEDNAAEYFATSMSSIGH